ncbi:MAG: MerP protein [Bacteroidetes bacterium]|nr:MAG: MerP protein [Bacteroidota bacterium]PTM09029.1 MAG: MerP protein [Bacteroidota bacterium]
MSAAIVPATAPTPTTTTTSSLRTKKVIIKTSAVCGMCKTTIEKALQALDGVAKAELDLVTQKVTVRYDTNKLDVATLRQAVAAAGYDADEVPARPKAYENLPNCCKKGTSCGPDEAKH